ncbi:MAG: tyrosine-type recombinase/integrase [Phenylobacterium sp.]
MPRRALTDATVAGLKAEPGRQTEHPDTKVAGLMLRVSPGGTKTWVMRYAAPTGERRRMKLGTYPALGLADARLKALKGRTSIEEEGDPAAERARARQLSRTVDELAEEYWSAAAKGLHGGRGKPKRASTLALEKQRYQAHASAAIGGMPFNKLTRGDIRRLERTLSETKLSQHTIAGVLGAVRAILGVAVYDERIAMNPATGVIRTAALEGRERHWTASQARALYEAIAGPSCEMEPAMQGLQRFVALTLVRRDEARLARWDEVDLEGRTWTIPAVRMKGGRTHVVPLSTEALAVLEEVRDQSGGEGWIFPSLFLPEGETGPRPLNRDAPYVALCRTCVRVQAPKGGLHDWRRTGATLLTGEALGVRRFVVSLLLAHNANEGAAVTAFYDRNDYLPEKRGALEAWGQFLAGARGE